MLKQNWREAWGDRGFRTALLISVPALGVVLLLFTQFLVYVEARPGVILNDPFLALFTAREVSSITFSMIYGALLVWGGYHFIFPRYLLLGMQCYALMLLVRMASMYLVPLDPPTGMISLQDPFATFFVADPQLDKDLFFSGHTSTMFLLFLTARKKGMRVYFLISTILVGACVLWQQTHYTIDVFVAPFMAYGCYRLVRMRWRAEMG